MKVLYFHQHFSTPSGSSGTRSYEMAKMLISRGHHVTMVCGSGQMSNTGLKNEMINGIRTGIVDGIEVIEYDLPYSNYYGVMKRISVFYLFAWRSIKIALTYKYDLLFATSTPLTAGVPGIIAKILKNKIFVFEVRDLWPEIPKQMGIINNPIILTAMSVLEWLCYNTANKCIGLSPGIVQGIQKRSIVRNRVEMIPNGCDLQLFNPYSVKPRRPSGVNNDDFLLVFTGAHGIANGLNNVLDVAQVIKKRNLSKIKFLFIGDGKTKPALIERAKKFKIDNCIFIDPVNKNQIAEYLKGANIGLMVLKNIPAFYYGTSPNKFFDYMAMGLPVINNYPGWISEMICKNNCGMVVSPDNPVVFADAVEYLFERPQLLEEMGRNARNLAEKEFDRTNLANIFVDHLENAVNKK